MAATPDLNARVVSKWLHDRPPVRRHALWWANKFTNFFEHRFRDTYHRLESQWDMEIAEEEDPYINITESWRVCVKVRYIFLWLWREDLLEEWHKSPLYAKLEEYAFKWFDRGTEIRAHQGFAEGKHIMSIGWANKGADPYENIPWTDCPFPPRGPYHQWFADKMLRATGKHAYYLDYHPVQINGLRDQYHLRGNPPKPTVYGYQYWRLPVLLVMLQGYNTWADSNNRPHIGIPDLCVSSKKNQFLEMYDAKLINLFGEGRWDDYSIESWIAPAFELYSDEAVLKRQRR